MHSISRIVLTATVLTGFAACVRVAPVEAYPPFAKKEGKPCAYCHVNPNGGKRNYRGMYYKAHNLAFTEFDDAAEAKKAGEEIGPDPTPNPTSYTAPKTVETPAGTEKPAPASEKKLTLKEAAGRVTATKNAYIAAPKDAAKKKAYAAALSDMGHVTMLDQSIKPNLRYPGALRFIKEALTLDPTNTQAKADRQAIADAYKSMGKPMPK